VPTGLDDLGPWLFTVAKNIAIDRVRARTVRPRETGSTDLAELPAVGDAFDSLVKSMTVRTALLNLSEKHRCVVVELYNRGASSAEAAVRLGIPEGTVKSRAHNATIALRAALEGAGAA
jgi:RNA polymerase sigma-70 factor (ECF subfamily)